MNKLLLCLSLGTATATAFAQAPAQPTPRRGGGRGQIRTEVESLGPTPRTALLVGEKNAGSLAIIDPVKLEVVARIPVEAQPHEVATDGRFAYISNAGANTAITVVDVAGQKRAPSIDTGLFGSFHGLNVVNGKLYVSHENTRMITRYDPATQKFDWALGTGGGSHLLIITPDERTIFTANSNTTLITILEATAGGRGGAAAAPASPGGASPAQQVAMNVLLQSQAAPAIAAAAARTDLVRASLTEPASLATRTTALAQLELDLALARADAFARLQASPARLTPTLVPGLATASLTPPAGTATGGGTNWRFTSFPGDTRLEGMALSPDGRELWVVNMNVRPMTMTVINVPEKKLVETFPLKTTFTNRMRFTPDGKHVLMNELQGTELVILDAVTHQEVKRLEVGAGGEGIFLDPDGSRAFYAVSNGNKLAVIDLKTFTVIKEITGLQNPDGMDWYVAK